MTQGSYEKEILLTFLKICRLFRDEDRPNLQAPKGISYFQGFNTSRSTSSLLISTGFDSIYDGK